MSWLSDNLNFEKFNLRKLASTAWKKPQTLLLGQADPVGAKLWSGITGKHIDPVLNIYGGPADNTWATPGIRPGAGTYDQASNAGIRVGPAEKTHDLAEAIATFYTGNWLSGLGGDGGQSGASKDMDWQGFGRRALSNQLSSASQQPGVDPQEERKQRMLAEMLRKQQQPDMSQQVPQWFNPNMS